MKPSKRLPILQVLAVLTLCSIARADRPRVVVTTDGERDDLNAMVRFLYYVNEWDVEGLIYSSSKFHWKGHKWEGTDWIEKQLDAYAKIRPLKERHCHEIR